MAESKRRYEAHPGSAPGDFYRVCDECVSCGVPQSVAPDLSGSTEDGHCYWKKQPETPEELERALDVINGSCVAAHHYAGNDMAITSRIKLDLCCDQIKQPIWRKVVDAVVVRAMMALMWLAFPRRKPPAD